MEAFCLKMKLAPAVDVFGPAREALRQTHQPDIDPRRRELGEFTTDWPDRSDFELDLSETIERTGAGLRLSRAPVGVWHFEKGKLVKTATHIYRLDSQRHRARLEFETIPFRAGLEVPVFLAVEPEFQGSFFFNLRDFLARIFRALLNGLKRHAVDLMWGRVLDNDFPLTSQENGRRGLTQKANSRQANEAGQNVCKARRGAHPLRFRLCHVLLLQQGP